MHLLIAVCAVGGLLPAAHSQAANLIVSSDLECRVSVDGQPRGVLKSGDELRMSLPPGEHRVEAAPVRRGAQWETTVTLNAQDAQELAIPLRAAVARAETKTRGYWIDREARLMWPGADNGFGVSWSQAVYYCRSLTLGGFKDWTLPAIDDLQRLFGGPANESGYRTVSPIKLTGWEWSASPGQEPGQQWALDFGDGARASVVAGDSGLNRALCVRRSGN